MFMNVFGLGFEAVLQFCSGWMVGLFVWNCKLLTINF